MRLRDRITLLLPAILLSASALGLHAQSMRSTDRGRGDLATIGQQLGQVNDNPFGETVEYDENGNPIESEAKQDTTKTVRIRKPLESYFFSDTLRSQSSFIWNVSMRSNRVKTGSIDTLAENFQNDYRFMRRDVGDAYVGNLGGAAVPLNYFRRPVSPDFHFASGYHEYIFTPENVPFYNVKSPFTQLGYTTAGQKKFVEEDLTVIHAQNISPSTGFNLTFLNSGAKGIYNWQKGRTKDLSVAFSHTGKRYSLHAGYIYNAISQRENGGTVDDMWVTDTLLESPLNVPMRMSDAKNSVKNNTVFLVQAYGVPLVGLSEDDFSMAGKPSFYVGHSLEYSRWKRSYTDTYSGTTYQVSDFHTGEVYDMVNYYDNWLINRESTRDTLSQTRLTNRVFLQLQPWDRDGIIGVLDAGLGMDRLQFFSFDEESYLTGPRSDSKSSWYAYASAEGKFRKYFDWNADLDYIYAGYRQGDYSLSASTSLSAYLRGKPISLNGKLSMRGQSPSYWIESYMANHSMWRNDFGTEKETRLEISLNAPYFGLEAGLYTSLTDGKIYYGPTAVPAQDGGSVNVTGVYLRKDLTAGNLHLNHRLMFQTSDNQEVAPVPSFAGYLSYSYEITAVKDVLTLRVGLDGWYNTRYYAFGWNPSVMQFYNQREKEVGGYPMLDAFVSAKWKRMRILIKCQHVNQDMFGTNDYFSILHYPMNQRVLKLGVSWNFYD